MFYDKDFLVSIITHRKIIPDDNTIVKTVLEKSISGLCDGLTSANSGSVFLGLYYR
jgi:hypothetical protein